LPQVSEIDPELAKERSLSYEREQYSLRFACRALPDIATPMEAQIDTAADRGSITKDVPSLRIDHITESPLLGVWRGHSLNAVV